MSSKPGPPPPIPNAPLYPSPTAYYEPPPPYDTQLFIESPPEPGLQPAAKQLWQKGRAKGDDEVLLKPSTAGGTTDDAIAIQQYVQGPVHREIGEDLLKLLLCLVLPPAAIFLHNGHRMKLHLVLNVLFCVTGWMPGIIHSIWYCFYTPNGRSRL